MDIKNNDFVYIKVNGIDKLSKVLDISTNNLSPVCMIKIIEDDSEMLVGAGVLEKINIFSLMKTNCPECGSAWSVTTEGVNDHKFCKRCSMDEKEICTRFRKTFVQSKMPSL